MYREMSGWTRKESLTMSPDCGVLGVLWDTGTPKKLWASEVRGRHAKTSSEHTGLSIGAAKETWVSLFQKTWAGTQHVTVSSC